MTTEFKPVYYQGRLVESVEVHSGIHFQTTAFINGAQVPPVDAYAILGELNKPIILDGR